MSASSSSGAASTSPAPVTPKTESASPRRSALIAHSEKEGAAARSVAVRLFTGPHAFGDGASDSRSARTVATMAAERGRVSAEEWFAGSERLPYDAERARFDQSSSLRVFFRHASGGGTTLTFLPGWPDGSFGWAELDAELAERSDADRLFLDYVGHSDSDKPLDYPYSTYERADLVEALWRTVGRSDGRRCLRLLVHRQSRAPPRGGSSGSERARIPER